MTPKIGDKVILTDKTLDAMRVGYSIIAMNLPASWKREVTVQKISLILEPNYTLITSDGYTTVRRRHEFIFPILKTCNCDLRLLMNRGCQCGAKL